MSERDVVLDVLLNDDLLGGEVRVGTLSRRQGPKGHAIVFEYDPGWLARTKPVRSFALDTELLLTPGRHYAAAGAEHLTAAFQDCSPDRWGALLMRQREAMEAKDEGRRPRTLTAWDYLVGVSDEGRMGAIRLRERGATTCLDGRSLSAPPVTELRTLEGLAGRVEEGWEDLTGDEARWLSQLIAPGSPLGGARPKATFRDLDGSLWIAKFPSTQDTYDVGLWELIIRQLACGAGVVMPDARAVSLSRRGHTFAVKRFDRTAMSRRCYASAMNLLGGAESEGYSYIDICDLISRQGSLSRIDEQLEQLFRRVVFGVLVGNRDDHLRNHGFLRAADGWELSPAFDINPSTAKKEHVLCIDESDPRPSTDSALNTAEYYRLTTVRAEEIIEEVRDAVARWKDVARSQGAKASEISDMATSIDPMR